MVCQNVYCFDLPTGEGVPQGLRGWGVRLRGSRGRVPLVGSDKVRGISLPCNAWVGEAKEPRRARPNEIWYNVLDHIL
ncbi:hypothetical protein CBR56_29425 [Bacillus thuringiensis]|nr:hypothetical protein BK728_16585 [Bacillus thuringiensis serovar chanpaisis]PNK22367.1 hypothetical protein CBR56_29425 [Bacillus thuringiensis]